MGFTVFPLEPADWDVQGNLLSLSACCVLCWLHHYYPPAKETALHFIEEAAEAQMVTSRREALLSGLPSLRTLADSCTSRVSALPEGPPCHHWTLVRMCLCV